MTNLLCSNEQKNLSIIKKIELNTHQNGKE